MTPIIYKDRTIDIRRAHDCAGKKYTLLLIDGALKRTVKGVGYGINSRLCLIAKELIDSGKPIRGKFITL